MSAASGMELMLRSLGLGQALEGVKVLVEQGALEKILKFSDEIHLLTGEIRRQRSEIEATLDEVRAMSAQLDKIERMLEDGYTVKPDPNSERFGTLHKPDGQFEALVFADTGT